MLTIKEVRVRKEDEVKVCDALVLDGDKFECYLSRFECEEDIEYMSSLVPRFEQYFSNEEFLDVDLGELYVVSENESLADYEGLEKSKYIKGYRILDKYMAEYLESGYDELYIESCDNVTF